MSNHNGWEELASENERLTGAADAHDRVADGTAVSATAGGPAAHGVASTASSAGGNSGSLAARSPSLRARRWPMARKPAGAGLTYWFSARSKTGGAGIAISSAAAAAADRSAATAPSRPAERHQMFRGFIVRLRQYLNRELAVLSRWPARLPACSSPRPSARVTFLRSRRVACPS